MLGGYVRAPRELAQPGTSSAEKIASLGSLASPPITFARGTTDMT